MTENSSAPPTTRRQRADARQNVDAVLEAAKTECATVGVNAPVRAIAERAGVGVGTIYRHFPLRSDLISAVFRREMDACVDAAAEIEAMYPAGEALDRWTLRYTQFVAAKRGLAAALHSGDTAYEPLAVYFSTRLTPTMKRLMAAATSEGAIAQEVDPGDFLGAVANLCHSAGPGEQSSAHAERMVRLLLAGLRVPAT